MGRRLKIALYNLTTTTKSGGIETFNWSMARYLSLKGHSVDIYGGRGTGVSEDLKGVNVLTYPYIPRERIPNLGTRFRKMFERLSFGAFALRSLVKGRYDLIYIHKPFDMPAALLASRLSGAKVVFGSGGTEFFPLYKTFAKRLDYFFACSAFNAGEIAAYCRIRPKVLYNGVDTRRFRPKSADRALRASLNIKENDKVLISACRLVGWKGLQYAIKALPEVSKRHQVKYLVIGKGEYAAELKKLSSSMGLEKMVSFLGQIPNDKLPEYYSLADIAIFPSVADETFGIAIAEAMASGVPVIATNAGGIPEVVGDSGVLVSPRDDSAIAGAILKLLGDDGLRKKLGEAGRAHVEDNFSWEKVIKRFEDYIG
ncbi:MAG: glycosyltransferase family 4 protein [Deltaproteobacteria bacterium]|nr:glycosyltransferase family 4 protein [Deltaproteobacteria bacterium]